MKVQPVRHLILVKSLLIWFSVEDLQNLLEELKEKANAISLKKSEAYRQSRGPGGMFTAFAPTFLIYIYWQQKQRTRR